MAIQIVTKGRGGTIETYFLDRQPQSCVVTLYTGEGSAKVSAAACTIDALNTTISAAAAAGDTTLPFTNASSVVMGRRYRVGLGTGYGNLAETVTVRSLSASTATLSAPLMFDHPILSPVKGLRVSYAVTSTQADATWFNGFADFDPQDGTDIQTETVECFLRNIPEQGCDLSDVRLVFADIDKFLSRSMDVDAGLKQARDRFLYDLGGKNRANAFIGTDIFRQAVAIKFVLLRRFEVGDGWAKQMDDLQAAYDGFIRDIQTQNPADNDQDGTTTGQDDGGYSVGRVDRA